MRINHNIASLNTYRQLSSNSVNGNKSLEKLSSGLRINRAGDDAAGLAISEKMRAQIRGLDQAARNAQDGISMIQTAEGALNETHSILQRMRELATQAANDTNVEVDRSEIQKEINQLTSEINRIGNTTEFNTQKLLDGGGSKATQGTVNVTTSGGKAGNISAVKTLSASATGKATTSVSFVAGTDTFRLTIEAAEIGEDLNGYSFKFVHDTTAANEDVVRDTSTNQITITTNLATATADSLRDLINGSGLVTKEVSISVFNETTGAAVGSTDALAAATGLNGKSSAIMMGGASTSTRGVYSFDISNAFVTDGDTATIRIALDGTPNGYQDITLEADDDTITGLGSIAFNIGAAGNRYTAEQQAAQIAAALNNDATVGALYDVTANGTSIVFTEKADKISGTAVEKVSVSSTAVQGEMSYTHTAQNFVEVGGKFTIDGVDILVVDNSDGSYTAEINAGRAIEAGADKDAQMTNLTNAINSNNELNVKYTASAISGTLTLTQNGGQESSDKAVMTLWDKAGNGFSASFQIGANSAQSMTVEINDMRSLALKISGSVSGGTRTASNGKIATFTSTKEVTNGTTNTGEEYALDVSTHDKATAAISVINDAIEAVSAERSKLGAYQNRLEHTINNLGTSSENLTASESRIRDVDMAKEMMEYTKNNILTQAATAMLAQANQTPQSVLQLLQ